MVLIPSLLTISAKSLGSASRHRRLVISCARVSRFKPPFVPRAVVGSEEKPQMIRTLQVTTASRGVTMMSSNLAAAFFFLTKNMLSLQRTLIIPRPAVDVFV